MSRLKKLIFGETPYVKVEDKNRFYYMLQQMQANRWKITMIVLFLFFFIIAGINSAVFFGVSIEENWKEMLLILFGAFVGNLNKVVDYWFNSERCMRNQSLRNTQQRNLHKKVKKTYNKLAYC